MVKVGEHNGYLLHVRTCGVHYMLLMVVRGGWLLQLQGAAGGGELEDRAALLRPRALPLQRQEEHVSS